MFFVISMLNQLILYCDGEEKESSGSLAERYLASLHSCHCNKSASSLLISSDWYTLVTREYYEIVEREEKCRLYRWLQQSLITTHVAWHGLPPCLMAIESGSPSRKTVLLVTILEDDICIYFFVIIYNYSLELTPQMQRNKTRKCY
jgi:hypothetical protein